MTVTVGVIGCGGMGTWHAANLIAQSGVSVVAVADANGAAARRLAARIGAEVFDADTLAGDDGVDAVVVASTDDSHARYAVAAVESGKHCFCEKPLGATLEQARAVLDAEIAVGERRIRVGFMREVDPAHAQLADAVASLGHITRVRCVHRNVDDVHREASLLFAQSLIHDIHTIRWLSSAEFDEVTVHAVTRPDGFHDMVLVGRLTNGTLGVIDFEDRAFAYEVHVEVTTTEGMAATLPHPPVEIRSDGRSFVNVGSDWFGRFEDAYRIEIEQWATDLRDDTTRGPTVWDGYAAQAVADAGERSLATGATVAVSMMARPMMYDPGR